LIAAGIKIMGQEGAHALSLREVARKAGVSHAAPYRHFSDKEALIAAIAEDGFLRLRETIIQAREKHPTEPLGQLRETAKAYVNFALKNPDLLRIMFGGFIADTELYEELVEAGNCAFTELSLIIKGCQKNPTSETETQFLSLTAWSAAHGLATLLINQQLMFIEIGEEQAESLADGMTTVLVDGLRHHFEK